MPADAVRNARPYPGGFARAGAAGDSERAAYRYPATPAAPTDFAPSTTAAAVVGARSTTAAAAAVRKKKRPNIIRRDFRSVYHDRCFRHVLYSATGTAGPANPGHSGSAGPE